MQQLPEPHLNDDPDEDVILLGQRFAWGGERAFGLRQRDRRQHTYLIGKSGTGKTTMLRNVLIQDLHAGRGIGLLDPHGDLARDLLDHIPPNRIDDVVYFNPADRAFPISFNLFADTDRDSRHLVASSIVGALKSTWPQFFGPRMEYILGAAVAALLECDNVSLLGLPRMLADATYRDWVLRQVGDPVVRSFWFDEFAHYDPRFMREAIAPIQNKVGQLLMSPLIRNILGQVRSRVDIPYIMDHRKILIANLSKGQLGEDKSNLLGALLVARFQQAAMSRAHLPDSARPDYHLVIDEFQNFSTDAVTSILSESRKYHLCLAIGHQYIGQLAEGVAEAVLGNVGTVIAFRVAARDGEILSREFGGHYDPSLFSTLDNHRVVVKLLEDGQYGDAFLGTSLLPLSTPYGRSQTIIRRSRQRYAVPRSVVEDKIRRWFGGPVRGKPPHQRTNEKTRPFRRLPSMAVYNIGHERFPSGSIAFPEARSSKLTRRLRRPHQRQS
jgi:hypothetical protein